jgi:hypothetical protein
MKSQRETERQYNKIVSYYEKDDFSKKVNCYVCACGHITKTIDIHQGVTPFKHQCEKCNSFATSSFYKDVAPNQEPTQEWYRPTLKQALKMRKNEALLEHILNGGLDNRVINQQ